MSSVATSIESLPGDSPPVGASPGEFDIEGRRRRDEVLVALGRRAIAAPSWRMLAQDAAALVAESLETSQFAVAELSDDRSTLTVRIAKTGETLKDLDAPAHIVTSEPTMSIAGYALSVAQSVSSADLADETRFQDPMLRQRDLAAAAAVPLLRGNRYFRRPALGACRATTFCHRRTAVFRNHRPFG